MILSKLLKVFLNKNYGFSKNCFSVILQIFVSLRSRLKKRNINTNWSIKDHSEFTEKVELNDLATSFWLRCILEKKYERVIEIGTRSGKRVRALKKICKNIEFYGLDIQENFKKQFEVDKVKFKHNNLDFFKYNKKKLLLFQGDAFHIIRLKI